MHFTKPTAKSYIYDAHLSQQEMLQLLMISLSSMDFDLKPHTKRWNILALKHMESIYRTIACIVLMLPLPPDAAHIVEMSCESEVHWQLKDQHGKGNVINQVHVHDDDGDEIITTPERI